MARVKERPESPATALGFKGRRRLKKVFTANDLYGLSNAVSDGRRYELVKGRLYEMAPAGPRHGRVTSNIDRIVSTYVIEQGIGQVVAGDVGFTLSRDPDTVRAPDVAYVSNERFPADEELPLQFAEIIPDLVVEVVSPSNTRRELQEKATIWLEAGVREVWIADPVVHQLSIHRHGIGEITLSHDGMVDGSPVLPGFTCLVADFYAPFRTSSSRS